MTNKGVDAYRPPEITFGFPACEKSDIFSISCVVTELASRQPLFPSYVNNAGPFTLYEKAYLFDTLIHPIPSALVTRLRSKYPGWFDAYGFITLDESISSYVKLFSERHATTFQVSVLRVRVAAIHRSVSQDAVDNDEEIREVLEDALRLDCSERVSLTEIEAYPFFRKRI